jgi:tRNA-(ms[2]io[6]A)-hydroxylase
MLGLACSTDPVWATRALSSLDRILVDHAHCEMKAASNAIALSARCLAEPEIVAALVELAEEELDHFKRVLAEIQRRGLALEPPAEDTYAALLLKKANASGRDKSAKGAVADRLLVGSLIEARSCERFKLLSAALRGTGEEDHAALADFYDELFAAEARHHRVFVELAERVLGDPERARARLAALAELEADVVRGLPNDATIHG